MKLQKFFDAARLLICCEPRWAGRDMPVGLLIVRPPKMTRAHQNRIRRPVEEVDYSEAQLMSNHPDPSHIMQVGMGFMPSKVLLSAVRLGLFTFLGQDGKRTSEIKDHLGLQTSTRHVCDWLDALVSLGFLDRDGLMEAATYSNTPATAAFLDRT